MVYLTNYSQFEGGFGAVSVLDGGCYGLNELLQKIRSHGLDAFECSTTAVTADFLISFNHTAALVSIGASLRELGRVVCVHNSRLPAATLWPS